MARRRLVELILFGVAAACPVAVALPLGDQFALPKLALALAMTGLLLLAADARFMARRLRSCPVPVAAAVALVVILAIATTTADHPRAAVLGTYADYNGLLYYIPGVVAFVFAAALVRGVGALERLVSLLAIGALPVLGYALVQAAGADPVSWDIDFGRRVFSTLGQPLVLGGYLATLLPMLVWLAMRRGGGERVFLLVESALAVAMLLATGTRGAYLGAIAAALVAGVILVAMRGVSRGRLATTAAVVLTIAVVGGAAWATGVLPSRMRSAATLSERTHLWRGAIEMAKDRPLQGWGPDQFTVEYGAYRPTSERGTQSPYEAPAASPHNETLMVLVGGGVPALAAYALLWCSVALGVMRTRWLARRRGAGIALAAALAGYLVQAQFSIPDTSLNVIAMTLLGALAGLSSGAARDRVAVPALVLLVAPLRIAGVALVGIALVLVAADYADHRGRDALARGESAAIDHIDLARKLNPLQATYSDDIATARAESVRWGVAPADARRAALEMYDRRIARFGAGVATYLDAADIASGGADTRGAMEAYLEAAVRADPRNPGLPSVIEEIRRNAAR